MIVAHKTYCSDISFIKEYKWNQLVFKIGDRFEDVLIRVDEKNNKHLIINMITYDSIESNHPVIEIPCEYFVEVPKIENVYHSVKEKNKKFIKQNAEFYDKSKEQIPQMNLNLYTQTECIIHAMTTSGTHMLGLLRSQILNYGQSIYEKYPEISIEIQKKFGIPKGDSDLNWWNDSDLDF